MKKIFIFFALSIFLGGCNDFLDVKPAGTRFLTELDAVASTMGAWMHNFKANSRRTADTKDAPAPWLSHQWSGYYRIQYIDVWAFTTWDTRANPLSENDKRLIDRAQMRNDWSVYYDLIGYMNLVIVEGSRADGDEKLRDILLGEAYIQRAYCFFKLLQYHAPVDDPSTGIPVHTGISLSPEESNLSRRPQAEVYRQILSDLEQAEIRLARTAPDPAFNIMYSPDWIYRIVSQIYLYKASTAAGEDGDWANAAKYAELALKVPKGGVITLPYDFDAVCSQVMNNAPTAMTWGRGYPEALGMSGGFRITTGALVPNTYNYSIDVWNTLYKDGDLRKTRWFLAAANYTKPSSQVIQTDLDPGRKTVARSNYNPTLIIMRLAEQWLIRVEGLAMSGDITGAQEALHTWRTLRYTNAGQLAMPSTAEDIQHEVYLERKREFLGETDILWLDMKRFKVTETRTVQDFTASLTADDFRWQFPIPEDEMTYNNQMVTNPGWSTLVYN